VTPHEAPHPLVVLVERVADQIELLRQLHHDIRTAQAHCVPPSWLVVSLRRWACASAQSRRASSRSRSRRTSSASTSRIAPQPLLSASIVRPAHHWSARARASSTVILRTVMTAPPHRRGRRGGSERPLSLLP